MIWWTNINFTKTPNQMYKCQKENNLPKIPTVTL